MRGGAEIASDSGTTRLRKVVSLRATRPHSSYTLLVPDILAIVSKAIFESDAFVGGRLVSPGEVWPVDRYNSSAKGLRPLAEGGCIILVTVRPPDEQLWVVGVIDSPVFDGSAWIGRTANRRPVMDISALRGRIQFASGRGLPEERGTLGMSLQSPRTLTPSSAAEILAVLGGAAVPASIQAPIQTPVQAPIEELPEARAVRQAREMALDREVERFVVLFDKMEETHGLRLPKHLAYGAGFLAGLTPHERAESGLGRLIGVGAWFAATHLPLPPDGDERLRDRVPGDPPELVPVLAAPDGEGEERWGLWYDDSNELPTGIALRQRLGRGHGTQLLGATFLTALRRRLSAAETHQTPPVLRWLDEVMRREAANVRERSAIPLLRPGWSLGDKAPDVATHLPLPPYIPNWLTPSDMFGAQAVALRAAAYESGAAVVEEWIDRAIAELRDGLPGRALLVGRELHEAQAPMFRLACSELLIRAYHALGRRPLADVVRAVYRHQGPELPLYELPPPHPVIAAVASGDGEEVARVLAEGDPPSSDEIDEALAMAGDMATLDALLDHSSSHIDSALSRRLRVLLRSRTAKTAARDRALALRLVERGGLKARAFDQVLRSGDEELTAAVAWRVELSSNHDGATPLHLAAQAGVPSVVRTLLARGADPRAPNAAGRVAHDVAREAQLENPNDPAIPEVMAMLWMASQRGASKPPLTVSGEVDYEEGDAVHHTKLGDGVVLSVAGEGGEAKLSIRFESETRTLLAKLVTPR